MSLSNYYMEDVEDETIMWVQDECTNCEYEISEDADVWYRQGRFHYVWSCPKCGTENEWTVRYD